METTNLEASKLNFELLDSIQLLLQNKNIRLDPELKLSLEFFIESLNDQNQFHDYAYVKNWFDEKRKACSISTEEVGINALDKWHVDPIGNILHDSGRFFKVIGVKVKGANREVDSWTQPIVMQKEQGILGILAKRFNGVRHYLLYAKYEPGNTHKLQLSPTLQATDSNLKLVHGGKKPLFAEYFEDSQKSKVLRSVISVEDGGRFYLKTNRNMIVEVDENEHIDVPDDFIWLTMHQIKKLVHEDNLVNSLARSILGSV